MKDVLDLEGEIWKDIEGFEGLYQVSNMGRVKRKDKLKKGILQTTGYIAFNLSKDGMYKLYSGHRLVAKSFIPNPDSLPCVNHINGIKTDNRVDNLEWCTYKQNSIHSRDVLGNNSRRLTLKQAEILRKEVKENKYHSLKEIEDTYHISRSAIYDILRNKSYHIETNSAIEIMFNKKTLSDRKVKQLRKCFAENKTMSMTEL